MSGEQIRPTPARELSPVEQQQETDLCFSLHRQIAVSLAAGRGAMWVAAAALHEFDQRVGWTRLGYDRKTEWLGDPEVSLSYSTYQRMLDCYRTLVLNRGVEADAAAELEMSKVQIVLPAIKQGKRYDSTPVTLKDVLADVRVLSASDLRTEYGKPREEEQDSVGDYQQESPEVLESESLTVESGGGDGVNESEVTLDDLVGLLRRFTSQEIESALQVLGYEAVLTQGG